MTTEEIKEVISLLKKISDHYVYIENTRSEDRNAWRSLSKRIAKIEKDRSERAKESARKHARKAAKAKNKAAKSKSGQSSDEVAVKPELPPGSKKLPPLKAEKK